MAEERPQYKVGRLRRALAEDPRTNELGIGVRVRDRDVHLTGEVACEERRRAVVEVARENLPGHEVYDELTVARIDGDTAEERLP
jgi:osmotically-inducible protein OsmY